MKPSLSSLFQSLPETDLPSGLSGRIFFEIARIRGGEVRRAILFARLSIVISGTVTFIAFLYAGSTILGSDFARLFWLVISDTLILTAYGWELFWFFLETLPAVPFVLLLVPLFFFLLSLGMYATAFKEYQRFSKFLPV